jgi:hypothetical protein
MGWTQADVEAMEARRAHSKAVIAGNVANLKQGPVKARRASDNQPALGEAAQPATRIGIDPAFRKNGLGVCVVHPDGNVTFPRFKGRGMVGLVRWIQTEAPENVLVTIEDSNLQNTSFDASGNKNVATRKARNVGCNQAISATIVDFCIDRWGDKAVRPISPQQKGRKWTDGVFKGIAKQNNHQLPTKYRQDDIDAYQLAVRK